MFKQKDQITDECPVTGSSFIEIIVGMILVIYYLTIPSIVLSIKKRLQKINLTNDGHQNNSYYNESYNR
jgi:hypothetical protein